MIFQDSAKLHALLPHMADESQALCVFLPHMLRTFHASMSHVP